MTSNSENSPPANPVPRSSAAHDALRALDAHVRPDFRRTIVFGAIALAALITGHDIGGVHARSTHVRLAAYGCALLVAVFGIAASQTAAREVQRFTTARAGAAAAAPLRIVVLLVGYLIAAITVCDLCAVDVGHLLIGGAITGIVVGLAAQPVLGNLFAGIVLLFARPYVPGQRIRVMAGAINGPHEGVIISAGLLYTTLQTADGPLNIPNSALMAAAVGPAAVRAASSGSASDAGSGSADWTDDGQAQKSRDLATAVAESQAMNHQQP